MIKEFQGEYRWLSNFATCDVYLEGIKYPSVEHAYMSAKSNDPEWKKKCQNNLNSAGYIKKQSRNIELVSNWNDIKLDIMKNLIDQKFNQEPFKSLLLETDNQHIQEGNMWNDKFWGVCLKTNKGENNLGKLIMEKRQSLKTEQ